MLKPVTKIEEGIIVAANASLDGTEYVVVAVEFETFADRIEASRLLRHLGDRLYGGLPIVLTAHDDFGRERYLGCGAVADRFEEIRPKLEWRTLYEDGAA